MRRIRRLGSRASVWLAALTLAALVATAPAGAAGGATASIVGGKTANAEEWPWTAFILATDTKGRGFSCTGTVVAPTLVLTAAHCAADAVTGRKVPVHRFVVVTGSPDVRNSGLRQISGVRRSIVYPNFNRFKVHWDAGLLVLKTPTTAPAIDLAGPADAALYAGGTLTSIAGWGLKGRRLARLTRTPVLQRGTTVVRRRIYCRNHARSYYPFFNFSRQLCTTKPPGFGTGTCHGDSGGPAVAFREDGTPVQIGITSLGAANCNPRLPDLYTRVDRIFGWVSGQIALTATGTPAT
jgi:secreted trypsin-like serine protease